LIYVSAKLRKKNSKEVVKPVLNDSLVIDALKSLHDRYVMVPIHKAANNIAFVCKRYYAKILLNEFGILGMPNPTYINLTNVYSQNIINADITNIKRSFILIRMTITRYFLLGTGYQRCINHQLGLDLS